MSDKQHTDPAGKEGAPAADTSAGDTKPAAGQNQSAAEGKKPAAGKHQPASDSAPTPFPPTRRGGPWPTIISLFCGILVAALAGYCLALTFMLRDSAQAYSAGDYDKAAGKAESYEKWAVVDKHRGPFNAGTALAKKDDLDGAEAALRRALDLTPEADECVIRQNLALVYEAKALKAREAGNEDETIRLLDEGIKVSKESPEGCRPPMSPQDQSQSEDEERMEKLKNPEQQQEEEKKKEEQQGSEDEKDGSEEEQQQGSEGEQEKESEGQGQGQESEGDGKSERERELDRRNSEGQRRMNESGQESSGGSNADKPW